MFLFVRPNTGVLFIAGDYIPETVIRDAIMIYVRDEIEEIVMAIQSSGTVSGFVDNDGSYTITTLDTGNLGVGMKAVLKYTDTTKNRDVAITAITDTTFTFDGAGIDEPDEWEMALYYEYGTFNEMNRIYSNKAMSKNRRVQEFPLFWLYTDFDYALNDIDSADFRTTIRAAIVDLSNKDMYESERMEQKFKPILYPYIELIEKAFNTNPFKQKFAKIYGIDRNIRFQKWERPFFGSHDKNRNVLPKPTDAIELQVDLQWINGCTIC